MNRREFLQTGVAAAGAGMAAGSARGDTITLKNLSTRMPLEDRIRLIQSFVHHRYYDPKGIMYSMNNFEEERPFTAADMVGADPNNLGIPVEDLYNYEDSPSNSGVFLAGQCYRYLATKEPEALEYAAKAFHSIDVIYQLSEAAAEGPGVLMQRAGSIDPNDRFYARPGWICKPYGGVMTTQTSTEQNFYSLWGLSLYRDIAPASTKARIDSMIVGVADLWRESGYKINFFGENWEFEKSMPRAQRHMPVWAWVNRLAFEVSQEKRFKREFQRLDALFGAMPTPQQTNFGLGREKYLCTEDRAFHDKEVVVADQMMDFEPAAKDRYLRAMTGWWKHGQIGRREDYYSYYYIELNTVTGEWRPLPKSVKPRQQWNSPSMWQNGTFPVLTCAAAGMAYTSAVVSSRNPEHDDEARDLARNILARLDRSYLRAMIDPENSLEPQLKYLLNILSDSVTYYPTAYWYGRLHKLW
jgi:hypothetical protein